jgi:hypothetical protein
VFPRTRNSAIIDRSGVMLALCFPEIGMNRCGKRIKMEKGYISLRLTHNFTTERQKPLTVEAI